MLGIPHVHGGEMLLEPGEIAQPLPRQHLNRLLTELRLQAIDVERVRSFQPSLQDRRDSRSRLVRRAASFQVAGESAPSLIELFLRPLFLRLGADDCRLTFTSP